MIERAVFSMEQAALGYIAFSITMVIGRLSGDYRCAAHRATCDLAGWGHIGGFGIDCHNNAAIPCP